MTDSVFDEKEEERSIKPNHVVTCVHTINQSDRTFIIMSCSALSTVMADTHCSAASISLAAPWLHGVCG